MNKNKTMKLELTHLAPYLPYDLKSVDYFDGTQLIRDVTLFNAANFFDQTTNAKPILRPLSDLTKLITHNGGKFVPMKVLVGISYRERINIIETDEMVLSRLSLDMWQYLYSLHFDIHNLIEQGLAIDINTLNS